MKTKALAKTESNPELVAMQKRMEEKGIILSGQMVKMIHEMKLDPQKHFYKVGSFKDASGEWKSKMEPTAFLLQIAL